LKILIWKKASSLSFSLKSKINMAGAKKTIQKHQTQVDLSTLNMQFSNFGTIKQ